MRSWHPALVLFLLLLNQAAKADQEALKQLRADILSSPSATQTLTLYCAKLHLAEPPVIHAIRDRALVREASPEIRHLLNVGAREAVRYRRVRLSCGTHVLSDADNWYVPSRLTSQRIIGMCHRG